MMQVHDRNQHPWAGEDMFRLRRVAPGEVPVEQMDQALAEVAGNRHGVGVMSRRKEMT
jgi:hypothetical protein